MFHLNFKGPKEIFDQSSKEIYVLPSIDENMLVS